MLFFKKYEQYVHTSGKTEQTEKNKKNTSKNIIMNKYMLIHFKI